MGGMRHSPSAAEILLHVRGRRVSDKHWHRLLQEWDPEDGKRTISGCTVTGEGKIPGETSVTAGKLGDSSPT